MDKLHKELMISLLRAPRVKSRRPVWVESYVGTNKQQLRIKVPDRVKLVRQFLKTRQLNSQEFAALLDSLFKNSTYHEEISLAGILLIRLPKLRTQLKPQLLDSWLNHTQGWAEIDSLCQSSFTAEELLMHWQEWKKLIEKLAASKSTAKRRASLVLLTKPVWQSPDKRLAQLAFKMITKHKSEKDVLITKAISWLLRAAIKNHGKEVAVYLKQNKAALPAIAVRETTNKLKTGRK